MTATQVVRVCFTFHRKPPFNILFDMFKDEIKSKLNLSSKILPYTISLLGENGVYVGGVKKVLATSRDEVVLKSSKNIKIVGEYLHIVEIGGGDLYIKGFVRGVEIE